jgi:hypothetical protein
MSRSANERITVRLSANDLKGLDKIRASGDFEDMSASVRWCIHFSVALLKAIPVALINSFVETNEAQPNDSLENTAGEVPAQAEGNHNHCGGNGGNGRCGNCGETKK